MYEIAFDEENGLLEIRLTGFWTTETVHAFHRDYIAAVDRYGARFPDFPTVSDSRGFAVMSAEANEAFLDCAKETAKRHIGRIAVVFQSRIAKLQAERTAQRLSQGAARPRPQRFFTEVEEARSWALNGDLRSSGCDRTELAKVFNHHSVDLLADGIGVKMYKIS